MKIPELLYLISQEGYEVNFSGDFSGMITITYSETDRLNFPDGYVRHEHVGTPGDSVKVLEKKMLQSVASFYEEVQNNGLPRKDGLAR